MTTEPNTVLYAVITAAGLTAVAAALVAAHALGRRRARRWPREAGVS